MSIISIYNAASMFLSLISYAIVIYCVLTWVAPRSAARYWLERFISPFCQPFRRLARYCCMRWGAPFDLTCLFAIIGLRLAQRVLYILFSMLLRLY